MNRPATGSAPQNSVTFTDETMPPTIDSPSPHFSPRGDQDAPEFRPLRFCMISIFYPPYSFGGDAIYCLRLAQELVRNGHRVDVIHCADSYHALAKDVDQSQYPSSDGVTVHRIESRAGTFAPFLAHQTGRPLLQQGVIGRILAENQFDVIHFHNVSLFGPAIFAIAAAGSPLRIMTIHDHWLVCPTNVLWKNGSRACDTPTCFTCTLRAGRPPQWWRYSGLMRRMLTHLDQLVAPSRFCAAKHAEYGLTQPIEVLPYFVPLVEPSTPLDRPHSNPYFLFVGRLEDYKGLQDVLPLFEGNGDFDLLVVGSGPFESQLRAQANAMPRVRFTDWINPDNLGPYYANALAVIVPTLTYETFGLVQVEAFSHGTPAIVSNVGALPEINREAGGGLTYTNRLELTAHLERLSKDARLRQDLGDRGRETFLQKWTPRAHLAAYEALINKAQTARRKPRFRLANQPSANLKH